MAPAEFFVLALNTTLLVFAILLLIPGFILFIECMASLLPRRALPRALSGRSLKVDVLVPAHNEESGIGTTVRSILGELAAHDRLIVIADNCVDDTAKVAREWGATVIERTDTERRGKGYALDFGIQYVADSPPDVVVLMDADCVVEPGSIEKIVRLAAARNRPVQATYLLEQPAKPSPKDAVSTLAFTFKNLVRPSGLDRLAMPCLLTGTGMAFPWAIIRNAPLASGNIVEDMQLGLDLALAGHAPIFCASARVTSVLPQKEEAAKSQRTRWEHGHLHTLTTQVPRLMGAGLRTLRLDLIALALDLLVPPLSLLVMVWLVALVGVAIAALLGASPIPTIVLGVEGALMVIAILAGWAKYCRRDLPAKVLLSVPLYVLWKIPVYFKFLLKPQKAWVRTERDISQ